MILAHRIALDPNNKQKTYLQKACGIARFAYNWGLDRWNALYSLGETVSEGKVRKELNAIKKKSFPWMMEVTKCAPQLAIMDLGQAFKNSSAEEQSARASRKKESTIASLSPMTSLASTAKHYASPSWA